jgi:hypothetical protein
MQKIIKGFARGQMSLQVLSSENVGQTVTELIDMGADIQSAGQNCIMAKFMKGSLPTGEKGNEMLKKLLDAGWVFKTETRTEETCDCDSCKPSEE